MVIQLGFPPQYVLDEMRFYEINAAMKYSYYNSKDGWEQARLITFMLAQVNSKKRLTLQDIIEFPWEEDTKESNTTITKEEIERLREQAQNYLKSQNKTIENR